jgi:hypothetical protein
MEKNKLIDTFITGGVGIIGVQWAAIDISVEIYSLFVQSLIATAAIGRLTWDILNKKKQNNEQDE